MCYSIKEKIQIRIYRAVGQRAQLSTASLRRFEQHANLKPEQEVYP
jgi:hypothetical protein